MLVRTRTDLSRSWSLPVRGHLDVGAGAGCACGNDVCELLIDGVAITKGDVLDVPGAPVAPTPMSDAVETNMGTDDWYRRCDELAADCQRLHCKGRCPSGMSARNLLRTPYAPVEVPASHRAAPKSNNIGPRPTSDYTSKMSLLDVPIFAPTAVCALKAGAPPRLRGPEETVSRSTEITPATA